MLTGTVAEGRPCVRSPRRRSMSLCVKSTHRGTSNILQWDKRYLARGDPCMVPQYVAGMGYGRVDPPGSRRTNQRSRHGPISRAIAAVEPSAVNSTVFVGKAVLKILSGGSLGEVFITMPIRQALREAALVIVLTLFVGFFGKKVLQLMNQKLRNFSYYVFQSQDMSSVQDEDAKRAREEIRTRRNVLLGLLDALSKPLEALVPIYCYMFSFNVLLTIGKVWLGKLSIPRSQQQLKLIISVFDNIFSRGIQFLCESTELVLIIFIGWTLIRMKDKVIRAIGDIVQSSDFNENEVTRFLQPLSQLLTWGISLGSALSCLLVLGIDVGPMLAVGSVSTIAIGFAAQSTASNLVAALSLYTSRSFIAGDRVQFKSLGGSTVVSGTVKDIQPMKTLVKCDNGSLVYVNNKDLATSLMVVNESETSRSKVSSSIPVIEEEIIVQYKDIDKVQGIVEDIGEFLKMHPDLDSHLSRRCCVMGFCTDGVRILIKGTIAMHARSKRGKVYTDIFLTSERIVRKHGAFLSQTLGYELPQPLD